MITNTAAPRIAHVSLLPTGKFWVTIYSSTGTTRLISRRARNAAAAAAMVSRWNAEVAK